MTNKERNEKVIIKIIWKDDSVSYRVDHFTCTSFKDKARVYRRTFAEQLIKKLPAYDKVKYYEIEKC